MNQLMEVDVKKHDPLHKDLAKTRMKRDAEVVELALKWFEKNNLFDHNRDKKLLVSSQQDSRAMHMMQLMLRERLKYRKEMQMKLDGMSVASTMEVKFKARALSSLRNIPG